MQKYRCKKSGVKNGLDAKLHPRWDFPDMDIPDVAFPYLVFTAQSNTNNKILKYQILSLSVSLWIDGRTAYIFNIN